MLIPPRQPCTAWRDTQTGRPPRPRAHRTQPPWRRDFHPVPLRLAASEGNGLAASATLPGLARSTRLRRRRSPRSVVVEEVRPEVGLPPATAARRAIIYW